MSLARYVINFDELTSELKQPLLESIDDKLRNKYPQIDLSNIESYLEDIKDILPSEKYRKLKNKIDTLIYRKVEGIQKSEGRLLDIPPIVMDYKEVFKFDKDIYLTGFHINQTGWKKEDRYSVLINKDKIIDKATLKEIGEHKYFNTFYKVNAKTPIFFILQNNSGNSRQTMVDLEYIEGSESSIIIEPPEKPTIDDIPNEWDIAVVMQWEENSNADMDLHGFIGDDHVYFGNRESDGFYLNFDYREHTSNGNPEILSVKGNKNKKLDIFIKNFNGIQLKEPVNIKIYSKKSYGNKLLKEINVKPDSSLNESKGKGVCSIDLKTLKITNIDKK
ncbi:hypothetical protein RBU49_01615 [Clostridium sp. MB40-C1]|uniref:hypothetical protein n=1 Tax=Clostridium sp. MB40-C1 TaxID=3070996 RepID=UPI0027DED28F|nr:hypothetical protein [Clostridium sp. MB40-C1]WMJ80976.1 hypothetical protein RBU49_01615 [Clostridium sp. MB40-C1]